MKHLIVTLACTVAIGCGGAPKNGAPNDQGGANSSKTGGPNMGGNSTPPGTINGSAQAATFTSAATPGGYSCSGANIVDASNNTVGACSGVYNTCSVCPLTNGASCVSSTPVCQGTLTTPDGQVLAFSSNGCNEVMCIAMTDGKAFQLVIATGRGSFSLNLSDVHATAFQANEGAAFVEPTRGLETSDTQTTGSIALTLAGSTPGASYTLKTSGSFRSPSASSSATFPFSVNVTGLVTEQL